MFTSMGCYPASILLAAHALKGNNVYCFCAWVTYRMCDGVSVVRGRGGVGGAGGPSMGPEPGAHFRVAQHAGQQGRHQHGRQDDHQHVQAAHWGRSDSC